MQPVAFPLLNLKRAAHLVFYVYHAGDAVKVVQRERRAEGAEGAGGGPEVEDGLVVVGGVHTGAVGEGKNGVGGPAGSATGIAGGGAGRGRSMGGWVGGGSQRQQREGTRQGRAAQATFDSSILERTGTEGAYV